MAGRRRGTLDDGVRPVAPHAAMRRLCASHLIVDAHQPGRPERLGRQAAGHADMCMSDTHTAKQSVEARLRRRPTITMRYEAESPERRCRECTPPFPAKPKIPVGPDLPRRERPPSPNLSNVLLGQKSNKITRADNEGGVGRMYAPRRWFSLRSRQAVGIVHWIAHV